MLKRDGGEVGDEEEQEGDDQKRDGLAEEGEGILLGPRLYREFWSSRGKKNGAGGTNFFAVRG